MSAIARVLSNLLADGIPMGRPFTRIRRQGTYYYNRAPKTPLDATAWQRATQAREAAHPVAALHRRMASADSTFVPWIKGHRSLTPVPPVRGECSMALLLLWEIDHDRPWPTTGTDLSKVLTGFTCRLHDRVRADSDLSWLFYEDVNVPLARGLPCSHHVRWSVQIVEPSTSAGTVWYSRFVAAWQLYLRSLVAPALPPSIPPTSTTVPAPASPTSAPASVPPTSAMLAPVPPTAPATVPPAAAAPVPTPAPALAAAGAPVAPAVSIRQPGSRSPARSAARRGAAAPKRRLASTAASSIISRQPITSHDPSEAAASPPARRPAPPPADLPLWKRQTTLADWMQPARTRPPPHGRAAEGPPT